MARRTRSTFFSSIIRRSLSKSLGALTRTAVRNSADAMARAMRASAPPTPSRKPALSKPARTKRASNTPATAGTKRLLASTNSMLTGGAGGRQYQLYVPPTLKHSEILPLLVMLHGCAQDAQALADGSKMNRIAARERFMVLYPEQNRLANSQCCWNWFDTRAGRAQREADSIAAAIDQVCSKHAIDPARIAIAGFSAGAGMAALLATRQPARFRAVVMHSGVPPGAAQSAATALSAMRGRRTGGPLAVTLGETELPALLVIQGSADRVVAVSNGASAAQRWAEHSSALANANLGHQVAAKSAGAAWAKLQSPVNVRVSLPRTVQRGDRRRATVTDYRSGARIAATLCEIHGLGHAWSGGRKGLRYSDPTGPDASRMLWAFALRQFAGSP